jgi:hypothetical protein
VSADLRFAGDRGLRLGHRLVSVLVTDAETGRPLTVDYPRLTTWETRGGAVRRVRVRIPPGTDLPARVRAYVLADVFPLAVRTL